MRVCRPTPNAKLANHLLPGGLEAYVAARRAEGLSWQRVADAIRTDTAGEVNVTRQALCAWFEEAA